MTELVAVLVIALLAVLDRRASERRLNDAFAQIAGLTRQLRAQADPQTFAWVGDPTPAVDPVLEFERRYLTDPSGLVSVVLEDT